MKTIEAKLLDIVNFGERRKWITTLARDQTFNSITNSKQELRRVPQVESQKLQIIMLVQSAPTKTFTAKSLYSPKERSNN